MIHNILLENFQVHKKLELELHPGVNVIAGPSDSGKSSVLRAIQWVTTNRPSGNSFRNWGGGNTSASITVLDEEGTPLTVDRGIRGKATGYYEVGGEEYKAFGTGVPEEVTEALNLHHINFQTQHDAPFLLAESAGEVARKLNRIAHLDVIDRSLAKANSEITDLNRRTRLKETDLQELEVALKSYDWLPETEAELETVEESAAAGERAKQTAERLRRTLKAIEEAKTSLEVARVQAKRYAPVIALEALNERRVEKLERSRSLQHILLRYRTAQKDGAKAQRLVEEAAPVLESYERWASSFARLSSLRSCLRQVREVGLAIIRAKEAVVDAEHTYYTAVEEAKYCPACGQPLPEKKP